MNDIEILCTKMCSRACLVAYGCSRATVKQTPPGRDTMDVAGLGIDPEAFTGDLFMYIGLCMDAKKYPI